MHHKKRDFSGKSTPQGGTLVWKSARKGIYLGELIFKKLEDEKH